MVKKEYNVGLDIGTTSVGWAAVYADNQTVMHKGGKALWGVRLFDEAQTAEARRIARSTRRRYDRRRERIRLLQDEFKEEMNKVDLNFYQKLTEFKYCEEDNANKKIKLSNAEKNELKKYQNEYKTIYHLRNKLVNTHEKMDIRLVYLAIHHIIKYRGNFLYQSSNFSVEKLDLKEKLKELFDLLAVNIPELDIIDDYGNLIDFDKLEKSLLSPSKNDLKVLVKEELSDVMNSTFSSEFGKLMTGTNFNLCNLLMIDGDKIELSFSGTDYDDKYGEYEDLLGENIVILDLLKQVYDCAFLKKLFEDSDNACISGLMVKKFNIHKDDLNYLKRLFRSDRTLYNKLFRSGKELCLYEKYVRNKIDYDVFKKELNKLLEKIFECSQVSSDLISEYEENVKFRIENGDFLPRITSTDNGKYPYQLNKYELIKIIENQGVYYPFLLNKTNDNVYKIVKLLEFRIPYYVGPLVSSDKSKNAWLSRKVFGVNITPYNFDEVVDKGKTAEEFIRRMMSHCSYLLDEYALPNNSILYCKYKVLNELKQIRIDGNLLSLEEQHQIFEDLFLKTSGVITERKFINYLRFSGNYEEYNGDIKITGYSGDKRFANNMQPFIDFFGENGIFEDLDDVKCAEEIIEWITIFEDKDILEKKIRESYPALSDAQIKKILQKKYTGWGSLSKKLLTEKYYKDPETELYKSIMDLMWETSENFMQILNNDKYGFQKMIGENNKVTTSGKMDYALVEKLATSPANKKGIYQSLKVIEELVDYIGYEPKNIVIEMAREYGKKERKDSRKDYLKKLYEKCKDTIKDYKRLKKELDSREITSQRLFLYFIQEGKCLYTGEPLNIEDIENESLYEIDHIIPRSLVKDNSIDNLALVLRKCNQDKGGSYVLPEKFRGNFQTKWWNKLMSNNLMSPKKFYNLTRKKFNNDDIEKFINRQLVETRQITKHVANILKNYYSASNVVYLKATVSHNYREKYNLFKFRDINDYHHAHDAYLAAVLGEFKVKFLDRKVDFELLSQRILEINGDKKADLRFGYPVNCFDENIYDDVWNQLMGYVSPKTGEVLFDPHEFNKKVEDTLYRNDILISRKTEFKTGQFYNETIYGKGKGIVPLKSNMPVELYGGYCKYYPKNLSLVGYNDGKKRIIGIPIIMNAKKCDEKIDNFIKVQIGLKGDASYTFIKKKIPFDSEFIVKGQNVYIKGYSASENNKNCEICNAIQLKIKKAQMVKWKYAFEYLLNKNKLYVNEANLFADDIYDFLVNPDISLYPLFTNNLDKIKSKLLFSNLNISEKATVIKELLKLYRCSSNKKEVEENGNNDLLKFGINKNMTKLGRRVITEGVIISKSYTGIKEDRYEF